MVSHCPVHSKPQVDQLMENIDIARAPGTSLFWEAPVMTRKAAFHFLSLASIALILNSVYVGRTLPEGRTDRYKTMSGNG